MNNNILAGIALITSLTTGGLLGYIVAHKQWDYKVSHFNPSAMDNRFPEQFFSHIDAAPSQKEQLTPILQKYGKRIGDMRMRHFYEMKTLRDTLEMEITPLLTKTQLEILERERHRPPHPCPPPPQDGLTGHRPPPPPPPRLN